MGRRYEFADIYRFVALQIKKLVLILLFVCATVHANLLSNGSFETSSPAGWPPGFTSETIVYYAGPAPAGTGPTYGTAWGFDGGWGIMGSSSQTVDVSGFVGNSYVFSAWLSAWTSDTDYAEVRLEFFNGSSGSLGSFFFDGSNGGSSYIVGSANSSGVADPSVTWTLYNWTLYEVSGTVPSGAVNAVVTLTSNSVSGNGNDSYIDLVNLDIGVEPEPPSGVPITETILIQPSPAPSGDWRNDFTGNLGMRFHVDQEVSVSDLAFYDDGSDGLGASHTVRIYESNDDGATGAVIASAVIPAGTAAVLSDGFRWVGLAPAVTLYPQTGTDWYALTATVANGDGDYWYGQGATGFTYNSFMDTAAGWQACYTTNPGAFPNTDSPAPDTTYYAYNMAATATSSSGSTITDGLVSYWPLDDGSGNTAVDFVGGHDGTRTGGASWVAGKVGGAIDTNNSGYIVISEHTALRPTAALSLQAWVSIDSFSLWGALVGHNQDNGADESGFCLYTDGSGVSLYISDASYKTVSASITAGQWTHLIGTYDSGTLRLYKNGALVDSIGVSGPIDWKFIPLDMNIGRYHDDNEEYPADARIDEVALWNRVLTTAEITYLYNSGLGQCLACGPYVSINEPDGQTIVEEGGMTDGYTVVLRTEPSADVQITITPGDAEIDLGSGPGTAVTLDFTSGPGGDWDTPQTITISAYDDLVYEGQDPHMTTITHSAVGGDYTGIVIASLPVAVKDNEETCGDWGYLATDLNRDCSVNLLDVLEFFEEWLNYSGGI